MGNKKTKISVIIPVVQKRMFLDLYEMMENNTLRPSRLFLIDNSEEGVEIDGKIPVTRIRPVTRMGVNESWNMGVTLSEACDLASILNDDIAIPPWFFEHTVEVFERYPKCGVVSPVVRSIFSGNKEKIPYNWGDVKGCSAGVMSKREGCAFTMRKSLADKIPPIPSELVTFCGDDWYWHWAVDKFGMDWMRVFSVNIIHYVGTSVIQLNVRGSLLGERRIFEGLINKDG